MAEASGARATARPRAHGRPAAAGARRGARRRGRRRARRSCTSSGLTGVDAAAHVYKTGLVAQGQSLAWDDLWYAGLVRRRRLRRRLLPARRASSAARRSWCSSAGLLPLLFHLYVRRAWRVTSLLPAVALAVVIVALPGQRPGLRSCSPWRSPWPASRCSPPTTRCGRPCRSAWRPSPTRSPWWSAPCSWWPRPSPGGRARRRAAFLRSALLPFAVRLAGAAARLSRPRLVPGSAGRAAQVDGGGRRRGRCSPACRTTPTGAPSRSSSRGRSPVPGRDRRAEPSSATTPPGSWRCSACRRCSWSRRVRLPRAATAALLAAVAAVQLAAPVGDLLRTGDAAQTQAARSLRRRWPSRAATTIPTFATTSSPCGCTGRPATFRRPACRSRAAGFARTTGSTTRSSTTSPTPAQYVAWLRDLGVSDVFVPHAALDMSSIGRALADRALGRASCGSSTTPTGPSTGCATPSPLVVGGGPAGAGPAPRRRPPAGAAVTAVSHDAVTVDVRRPGSYVVKFTWTPYWRLVGSGAARAAPPGQSGAGAARLDAAARRAARDATR